MNLMKTLFAERKRKKSLPVPTICYNCGTSLHGPYCHKCGQKLFSGIKRSIGDLVFNMLENIFALDSKIFLTLKYLLFYPGKLTKEYINGRIISYVYPAKLFWFFSIIFFAVLTFHISSEDIPPPDINPDTSTLTVSPTSENVTDSIQSLSTEKFDTDETGDDLGMIIVDIAGDAQKVNFKHYFSTYFSYVVFLLIPFFAFLLYLFFRKKNYYYTDCLAFALHFHAFVFLLFTLYLGIRMLWANFVYHKTVFILIPIVYFLTAVWTVFRPRKIRGNVL